MKAADSERELFEQLLQQRNQPAFGDLRRGSHDLPLRHLVDRIDVINAFDSVPVSLVHGVDAQIPGPSLRPRFAPLADRDRCRPCWLVARILLAVGLRVAEPVELRHGDARQPRVHGLAVFAVLALQDSSRRRSAQVAVTLVHIRQQFYVCFRVAGRKLRSPIHDRLYPPAVGVAGDQPCHLGSAQACHSGHIPAHQTLLPPAQDRVLVLHQRSLRPGVYLVAALSGEPHAAAACEKRPDLFQACRFRIVHADDQSPASRCCPLGSSCMRIQCPFQAHLA